MRERPFDDIIGDFGCEVEMGDCPHCCKPREVHPNNTFGLVIKDGRYIGCSAKPARTSTPKPPAVITDEDRKLADAIWSFGHTGMERSEWKVGIAQLLANLRRDVAAKERLDEAQEIEARAETLDTTNLLSWLAEDIAQLKREAGEK